MARGLADFYRHVTGTHGFDYDRIEDDVYLGTNMCCQFGFDRELLQKGITADISLEGERIDEPAGVEFFLWLPTIDKTPPSPDALEQGVAAIALLRRQGKKIYLHCKNGHGRAPTLYIAYLISTGMGVDEAMAYLKERRSSIHLESSQLEALRTFAERQR